SRSVAPSQAARSTVAKAGGLGGWRGWRLAPCDGERETARASLGGALLQEAFVVAHHHLRLHLAHRVERHADDDQNGGAAERAGGRLREAAVLDEEAREDGDRG